MRWLLLLGSFTLLELVVLWQVGLVVGFWPSVAIIAVTGLLGGGLAKREGLRVFRQWSEAMGQGRVPEVGLVDGVLVLLGGVLLFAPGFVGDVLGLTLLFPPTRRLVAGAVRGHLSRRFGAAIDAEGLGAMRDGFGAAADGDEAADEAGAGGFGGLPFGTFTVIRGGDVFSSSQGSSFPFGPFSGEPGFGDAFDGGGFARGGRGGFRGDDRDIVVVDTTGEAVDDERAKPILALPAAPSRDEEKQGSLRIELHSAAPGGSGGGASRRRPLQRK